MRSIYIDDDFHCHVTDDGTMAEIQTAFFDNKCDTLIEGYRFIPTGESWVRKDGRVFIGEMISPWKPYFELDKAQREYEKEQLTEAQSALEILFGEDTKEE